MSLATHDARLELAEWDPFAPEPEPPADEPAPRRPKKKGPDKTRRAPARDISAALEALIAEQINQHAYEVRGRWSDQLTTHVDDEHIIAAANAYNVKYDVAATMWRRAPKLSAAERAQAERDAAVLRRLAPMRHLIALAHAPNKAEPGEIDDAAAGLGAVVEPELRGIIADVALALDLAAQVRELTKAALPKLFAIYDRMLESEPNPPRTLVVNYARDNRATSAIYPHGRFADATHVPERHGRGDAS